jgi:hypothetical protein
MLLEAASTRPALGDNNPAADDFGYPPEWLNDLGGEPTSTVGGCQQSVDVDELGLELGDQDSSRGRMPGDEVDDTSLPVVAERHLRPNLPAGIDEDSGDDLRHLCVPRREDAVRRGAAPPWLEWQADLEGCGHAPKFPERDGLEEAPLDLRIGALRDASPGGHGRLGPTEADPDLPEQSTDSEIIHDSQMVVGRASPALRRG